MNQLSVGGFRRRFRNTFIGTRGFYRTVFALVLPIIAQNIVTSFVNLLDNVMVGRVGTEQMSGVAITNQLLFVYMLAVFGAISGAGIFGAQFAGAKDWEGLRQSFRFKLLCAVAITAVGIVVLHFWDEQLIALYLKGKGDAAQAAAMLDFGRAYLRVMLWGLFPFTISLCYSSTLRETGETLLPMVASISAVLTNLVFNYLLIYGKFGFPQLGVKGAAIATVMSRFVEFGIIVCRVTLRRDRYGFLQGVYRRFRIGRTLAANIAAKGMPLLLNELLWSLGMTTQTQIFSTCGLLVVAGINIASTVTSLFNVFYMSIGTAVAVMVGQALGAGDIPLAKNHAWKLVFFSICVCIVLGSVLAAIAGVLPGIYNTEEAVRRLAASFMRTSAMYMAFNAVSHCCYFTLRSGGKTWLTFLFDSAYMWVVCVPFTFLLVRFTGLRIELLYPLSYITYIVKCVIGILVVRTGRWANNMVADQKEKSPS